MKKVILIVLFISILYPTYLFSQKNLEEIICAVISEEQHNIPSNFIIYECYKPPRLIESYKMCLLDTFNIDVSKIINQEVKINPINCLHQKPMISKEIILKYKNIADSLDAINTEEFKFINQYSTLYDSLGFVYCEFSYPLLSPDGRYAAIDYHITRGAMFGDWGAWLVLENVRNQWKVLRIYAFEEG
jgi:hypothetical protein